MLQINMDDVVKVVNSCKPYLIFFGVVLVLAIIAMIACRKMKSENRKFVRAQSGIAILLALVIAVNMICFIPMATLITLATGDGTIMEETSANALEVCEKVAEEGIVLLKNEGGILPLADNKNLNVFGWASTNPCYGGTGSGSLSDAYDTVSFLQGLENAGFNVNKELTDFYKEYRTDRPVVGMMSQDWTLPEPPAATYGDALIQNARAFSDTAAVVITRVGGEGADLPVDVSKVTFTDNTEDYKDFEDGEHYLQLSRTEKDMLDLVCSNFDKVVVIYNSANTMELGFIDEYSQIKGALWCPGTGQSGFNALGQILGGTVNPSGKTSDTFVRDLTKTLSYDNFGSFLYDNMDEFKVNHKLFTGDEVVITPSFVNYAEGIYVGYRFYETAFDTGAINYEEQVIYPFGYGLSYTEFNQKMENMKAENGTVTFDVAVTNTGNTAGKEVVEVYYNPPYTNGGIEKATANLIEFAKTDLLKPGETQTVTISFSEEEMASFDSIASGCYVLEQGDYKISIRQDSHSIIEEQVYTVENMVTYDETNPRSSDNIAAVSRFEDAKGNVTYLSRENNFQNLGKAIRSPENMSMPEEAKEKFLCTNNYNPEDYNVETDEMPETGVDNGLKLIDLRGTGYEDPKWDMLLDEMTVGDMDGLIALAGYQTAAVKEIEKVQTIDCDGPASINNNFTRIGSIGFPSAVMIANTWNIEIAEEFGESIGRMADEMGVSGWYAPAMNTHRSAFSGRNFEYYSEDGVLAGYISANAVLGAKKYGVYAYMKHFAMNDQELNRGNMLCTWSDEQAIREIYLKPFEIAVKEGDVGAVMSAFNYIGTEWAGASNALLNQVLRDEWGFKGMVLTDMFANTYYMNADQAIRNGNDAMLCPYDSATNHVKDQKSATGIKAMRQASKNILYTVVNSRAYEEANLDTGLEGWKIAAIVVDIVLAAGLTALEIVSVKRYMRRKREVKLTVESTSGE